MAPSPRYPAQRSTLNAQPLQTLNAQPLQTLNLPIIAAQPQSLPPRSGAVIRSASEVICHPSCACRTSTTWTVLHFRLQRGSGTA
ncbi:MAG: hypothetical protein M0Q87_12235 [Ottowia sp.]|nr:hypothetical protein [Ottowia sp.]